MKIARESESKRGVAEFATKYCEVADRVRLFVERVGNQVSKRIKKCEKSQDC
jgi:hypothetical protein